MLIVTRQVSPVFPNGFLEWLNKKGNQWASESRTFAPVLFSVFPCFPLPPARGRYSVALGDIAVFLAFLFLPKMGIPLM